MPIYEGSRYESATVIGVADAEGVTRPTVYASALPDGGAVRYALHAVGIGETIDILAYRVYGSPRLWWAIALLNPELLDPQDISPGTIIRVPR